MEAVIVPMKIVADNQYVARAYYVIGTGSYYRIGTGTIHKNTLRRVLEYQKLVAQQV